MKVERTEGALILHTGMGDWYNQRAWGMCEDVDFPPASWHAEVDAAIHSHRPHPSVVVIDTTEMIWLALQDYGFLSGLSKKLKPLGIRLTVVARVNEVRAWEVIRRSLQEYFSVVGTLEEALREQ